MLPSYTISINTKNSYAWLHESKYCVKLLSSDKLHDTTREEIVEHILSLPLIGKCHVFNSNSFLLDNKDDVVLVLYAASEYISFIYNRFSGERIFEQCNERSRFI